MEIPIGKSSFDKFDETKSDKSEINDWTSDIEEILDKIRVNSSTMCEFHKSNYYRAKSLLKFFKLPTIILSGLSSIFSVGLQPYVEQMTISLITCLIGLFIGIINSIELFLAIQTTMENELKISKKFYLLSVDIFKVLMLKRHNRGDKGKLYLEEKYNIYCKLVENSVLVNTSIIDKLVPLEISYKSTKIIQRNSKNNELRSTSFLSISDKSDKSDKINLVRPHGIIPIITSNSDDSLNTKVIEVPPNLIESERSSPSTENA